MPHPKRLSVDLSAYPDLVVVYLGYRASSPRGLVSLARIGLALRRLKRDPPPGLLAHEGFMLGPLHGGFRQYWSDLESLTTFTRAAQHAAWWATFGHDPRGGGFWHETYCRGGGIEALYLDMPPTGLGRFAPPLDPVGAFMTSAQRLAVAPGDARSRAAAAARSTPPEPSAAA